MSWSASLGEPRPANEIKADNFAFTPQSNEPELSREQFENAVTAARALADAGVVGDEPKSFYVNLSGHANANHEPAEGWANDMLSISISQASPPPTASAE